MGIILTELDLRRRNCRICTRWKHAIEFPWRWRTRSVDREIPLIGSMCLACKAGIEKKRYAALPPDKKREKAVKANEQAFKRRTALQQEVTRLEIKKESLEIKLERYRKRVGRPQKSYRGEILLDILPFRMFLLRQARLSGSVAAIADQVGSDAESVRRYANGFYWESDCRPVPIRQVTLGVVDKYLVLLNTDERLDDLYPEVDDLLDQHLGGN